MRLCDEDRALFGILCVCLVVLIAYLPLVVWWWMR